MTHYYIACFYPWQFILLLHSMYVVKYLYSASTGISLRYAVKCHYVRIIFSIGWQNCAQLNAERVINGLRGQAHGTSQWIRADRWHGCSESLDQVTLMGKINDLIMMFMLASLDLCPTSCWPIRVSSLKLCNFCNMREKKKLGLSFEWSDNMVTKSSSIDALNLHVIV